MEGVPAEKQRKSNGTRHIEFSIRADRTGLVPEEPEARRGGDGVGLPSAETAPSHAEQLQTPPATPTPAVHLRQQLWLSVPAGSAQGGPRVGEREAVQLSQQSPRPALDAATALAGQLPCASTRSPQRERKGVERMER
eukprot:293180-Rhodomonas_salina.1